MSNEKIKNLCLKLMFANTEDDVIDILKKNNLWDNPDYWRFYGDQENNYSSAGNQADEAEAALIEKITNARDAILMNECLERGINPEGAEAPKTVREAVASFFEENPNTERAGQIKEWDKAKRREIARKIAVYVTGNKPRSGFPCINIVDIGEGQTPRNIPKTFLSLGKSIKLRIPFVHGKFNMGGTAVLPYCGKQNLQLVLSKRNPKLLNSKAEQIESNWGFTVVRREDPEGNIYSSVYKYLVPRQYSNNEWDILNFNSDEMPIFPHFNTPYKIMAKWGTLIKLYEYETQFKQNVQGNGGLLRPLDLLAPDLGLPYRLHECRYEGTPGSFEHQLNGLKVRLFDNKDVIESDYPTKDIRNIDGEEFRITVYAFKDDKAPTYRDPDKGVIFTLNGQSQGWIHDRIFSGKKIGLGFLKKSLLVMVDCSNLSHRAQERLFVNDRVHLRKGDFLLKIEDAIVDYLSHHPGLRELQEERVRQLKSEKLSDSKPLETVLSNMFRHSSSLSKIFLKGEKLSNAFRTDNVDIKKSEFNGKKYPTFFRFKKLKLNQLLKREANIGSKSRILFETDAENTYFDRKTNPGEYKLFIKTRENDLCEAKTLIIDYGLNLFNGIATLNIHIDEKYKVGDSLHFILEVTDPMRKILAPPFKNEFILNLIPPPMKRSPGSQKRIKPPGDKPGDKREKVSGINFPDVYLIYEDEYDKYEFNKYTGMKAKSKKNNDKDGELVYSFFINMDNIYLQHEMKQDINKKKEFEAYFQHGMTLLGISTIYDIEKNKDEKTKDEDVEKQIEIFTRAMSPTLIPMIRGFGELDLKTELLDELSA